jgi:CRP-like cAMP-binding protein
MTPERYRNHLLSRLSSKDLALINGHLKTVELAPRMPIEERARPIERVYFPEDGIVSVVAVSGANQVEAGIVGREGMTGIAVILGDDRSANTTFVQVTGSGLSLEASVLRKAMQKSGSMQLLFLRFVQAFMTQMSHTALANGRAKVEERLARWLLMAHDRVEGPELSLTHEFLAVMLGVRRAGVTLALQALEDRGFITAKRGLIMIENRPRLLAFAGAWYGVPEAEYRRLTSWSPRHKSAI